MKRLLLSCVLFLARSAFAQENETNTIVVRGHRSEKQVVRGPLRGTTTKPQDASRFDLDSQYRDQASVLTVRTGEVKPSGFNVPRIRGQDARTSDVYVDSFSLSSPYTGLPLVDELDLRAFDSVTIYQGISGVDLPSVNPVGALQLSLGSVYKPSISVGTDVGKPHGLSEWFLVKDAGTGDLNIHTRIYVRHHKTDGVYSFYSDEGTPYQTSDDRIIDRKDNASESLNSVQSLGLQVKGVALRYVGLLDNGEHEIPSMGGFDRTYAARSHAHYIHQMSATKEFEQDSPLETISFYGSREDSKQINKDPEGRINPQATHTRLRVNSSSFGSRVGLRLDALDAIIDASKTTARIALDSGDTVERQHQKLYLGLTWNRGEAFELMAKLLRDTIKNDASSLASSTTPKSEDEFEGFAIAVRASPLPFASAYAQLAKQERPPAMFEEFGDGGSVLPSDKLGPEIVLHKEVGIELKGDRAELILAYFRDQTDDKIIVLPSSLPNAWRAQNLDKTVVSGYEVQTYVKLWNAASLRLSVLQMEPKDKSDPTQERQLPQLAKTNGAGEFTQGVGDVVFRWASRYRGPTYRDTRNSVRLDELWVHDVTADYRKKFAARSYAFGGGLFNVLDTTSTGITSVETGDHGRTAITEVRGYPLPGRHWKLYSALTF